MQDKLEMLRIFKVVAESANFKDASVRLGISPQSVTRAIKELEMILGEPLFYRSTRNTTITEFGKQMALKCVGLVDQIDAVLQPNKIGVAQGVEGLVKITMSSLLGRRYLMPALTDFLKHHPGIQLDLRFSDLIDNVVADQMDIGVRIGFFNNNRNIARRVNEVKFHIVGTPEMIAKTGQPETVEALFKLPYTCLIDVNTGRRWPWIFANASDNFSTEPTFVTDDPEAELAAVLAGIGYGQIADFVCAKYIESGQLVTLLAEQSPTPWGIYVYRPQRGPVAERVRVVFDYLVEILNNPAFYKN